MKNLPELLANNQNVSQPVRSALDHDKAGIIAMVDSMFNAPSRPMTLRDELDYAIATAHRLKGRLMHLNDSALNDCGHLGRSEDLMSAVIHELDQVTL